MGFERDGVHVRNDDEQLLSLKVSMVPLTFHTALTTLMAVN